jgi:hypothetical protein
LIVLWEEAPLRKRSTFTRTPPGTAWYVRATGVLGWVVSIALTALLIRNYLERSSWTRSHLAGSPVFEAIVLLFLATMGLSTVFWMHRLVSLVGRCGVVAANILDRRKDVPLPFSWFGALPLCLVLLTIVLAALSLDWAEMNSTFRLQLAQMLLITYGVICLCAACAEMLRASRLLKTAVDPSFVAPYGKHPTDRDPDS